MKKTENPLEETDLPEDEDSHALLNRQEDKYFLPKKNIEQVIQALSDRLALGDIDTDTRYNTNRTIYLDDKDLNMFHDCMLKKKPRLKVRIRQYSPNSLGWEEVAYAEFKMKEEDGFTKKIRVRIPATEIDTLCNSGQIVLDENLVNINKDIDRKTLEVRVKAINSLISKRGLKKQLEVQYERRAYTGKNIRITIDENLRFLEAQDIDQNVKDVLEDEKKWKEFSESYILAAWKDPFILEIKTDKGVPSWLNSLLKDTKAKEASFSKYCAAILNQIKTGKDSGKILGTVGYLGSIENFEKSEECEAPPLTKPYSSEAQRRWAHTAAGKEALGGEAGVHEWDEATKSKKLPEKVGKSEDLEKSHKVDIAVVVLKDGNFILVGKRRRNKKWGLPGGRNEKDGESNKAAALRELEEEAGIKLNPKDLTLAGVREVKAGGEKKRVHVFTAQFPGGEPTTKNDPDEEFTQWRWIRCEDGQLPDEILDDEMTPPAEAAFEELEMTKTENLQKGALKNILTAGSMAAALASPHTTDAKVPSHGPLHPQVSASPNNNYSREKMLNAISQVESSGGKNMNHKPTSQGTAYGRWAVMPSVIQDTIRLNPKLKQQYGKGLRLRGDNLTHYMQDNPKLEQEIVNSHLNRLEHHFGHNPEAIAYGWNQGITNTNRSLKAKKDISAHPYVQKFKHYYESEK